MYRVILETIRSSVAGWTWLSLGTYTIRPIVASHLTPIAGTKDARIPIRRILKVKAITIVLGPKCKRGNQGEDGHVVETAYPRGGDFHGPVQTIVNTKW